MVPGRVAKSPRIFVNNGFAKFVRKNGIADSDLCFVVRSLQAGIVDADLGGGLYKQRVPRKNEGKSGGFRTILIFNLGLYCVFVYGFAKNERASITPRELADFKRVAKEVRAYDDESYHQAVRKKVLHEVFCEEAVS